MKKTTIAAATAVGAGLLFAVTAPLAASAHVSLDDNEAEAGSYALLTFKVPNESATAATNLIELQLPTDTPFTSVSYVPTPGWETTVTDTTVTWAAEPGAEIVAGELQLFSLSLGPVPDVDSVTLPVTQTYDDGTVVEWNGEGDEPAPVLYVNAEPESDHHASDDASDDAESDLVAETDNTDVLARVLGIVGLVIGAVGVVLAVTARRTR
jgi:uncharacterized protein YcnI